MATYSDFIRRLAEIEALDDGGLEALDEWFDDSSPQIELAGDSAESRLHAPAAGELNLPGNVIRLRGTSR
jgi:hypothetical protein